MDWTAVDLGMLMSTKEEVMGFGPGKVQELVKLLLCLAEQKQEVWESVVSFFSGQAISGQGMLELSNGDMEKIGISHMGVRKVLSRFINRLNKVLPPATLQVAPVFTSTLVVGACDDGLVVTLWCLSLYCLLLAPLLRCCRCCCCCSRTVAFGSRLLLAYAS